MKLKKGDKLPAGVRVEFANSDTVDTFGKEVEQIMDCIGVRRYMVTDWSSVGDFQCVIGTEVLEGADIPKKLSELIGREVTYKDLIGNLARELWQKQQVPTVN